MKSLSRKIGLLCGLGLCAMATFAGNSITVSASVPAEVETYSEERSTILQWIYKEFDGVMYMRLYNHSTGEWETDWIPAE